MVAKVTVAYDDTALPYVTPAMTADITAAVTSITRHYNSSGTLDVLVKVEDLGETTLAQASPDATVYYRTYVQPTDMLLKNDASTAVDSLLKQAKGASYLVYQAGSAHELATGTDPNGTAPDITLSISQTALTNGLFWLDPDPREPTPAYTPLVPADQYDLYDVVRHEMGHALGLTTTRDLVHGLPDSGTMSTLDRWITFVGTQPSPLPYLTGPSVTAVYGGPLRLVDGDFTRYAEGDGLLSGTFNGLVEMGTRGTFNALDLAMLRDDGILDAAALTTGTAGNDVLAGTNLDDVISGGAGNDTILGGIGNDVLAGGTGNDSISGDVVNQSGEDVIQGDGGNDRLDGGGGNDWIDGGADNDTIIGANGTDTLYGSFGDDSIYGDFTADRYNYGINAGLSAATAGDIIDGGAGNDWIEGGAGADLISGGTGADTFAYVDPSDSTPTARDIIADFRGDLKEVFAEDGTRTITFSSVGGTTAQLIPGQDIVDFRGANAHTQRDRIDLSEMDADLFTSGHQGFTFIGQAAFTAAGQLRWEVEGTSIIVQGNVDSVTSADFAIELQGIASTYSMTAADFILGTSAPAARVAGVGAITGVQAAGEATPEGVIVNLATRTVADGYGAVQSIPYARNAVGTYHGDRLTGDTSANALYGDDGDDTVNGDIGADTLYGGYGQDQLFGSRGNDVLYGNADDDRLCGNRGSDILFGGAANDVLYGNFDNDALYGNAAHDTLYGGSGDDLLFGGLGNDALFGGAGADQLYGGAGNNLLFGGDGADRFVIGGASGGDVIGDFNGGAGDRIAVGANWQLGQDGGGNAVLTLSGGHTVTVLGVPAAGFNPGWVVPV